MMIAVCAMSQQSCWQHGSSWRHTQRGQAKRNLQVRAEIAPWCVGVWQQQCGNACAETPEAKHTQQFTIPPICRINNTISLVLSNVMTQQHHNKKASPALDNIWIEHWAEKQIRLVLP